MAVPRVVAEEVVIFVVGGANDAPGYKIVVSGGHVTVVPIPGWNPEASLELGAALRVVAHAAAIKNPEASRDLLSIAGKLAQTHIAGLNAGGGHTTVVFAQ